jgi:hypothetical protein
MLDQVQAHLQLSQTLPRFHDDCAGSTYPIGDWFEGRDTDDPTWMFVTADVVWTCCNMVGAGDGAIQYWQDGPGLNPGMSRTGAQRMVDNVLIGETVWVNAAQRFSETAPAVHIEADPALGDTLVNSPVINPVTGLPQSFYHHHSAPYGLSDLREPLPTAWGFSYTGYYQAEIDTLIRVWKAPTTPPDLDFPWSITDIPQDEPWTRPTLSHAFEMAARDCLAYTYYAWDDDETVVSGAGWDPNLMPLVTQEVSIDQLVLPDSSGWILLAWPHTNTTAADLHQAWVTVKTVAFGDYSTAQPAAMIDNANCRWGSEILRSGFERGDSSVW